MSVRVINADVMNGLAQLADESVHTVCTSPPYWGLRDYGAVGQIGLEPTFADHLAKLVEVFRDVRRVLRKDGTLWLNYGDAYAQGHGGSSTEGKGVTIRKTSRAQAVARERTDVDVDGWGKRDATPRNVVPGLKPKDLMLMPERLAIALQDDGWWIRSRIIWSKPNPMPESVTDRPTKSHEHIWLMSKAPRYFYDAEAIREPHDCRSNTPGKSLPDWQPDTQAWQSGGKGFVTRHRDYHPDGRNARDVWTIATSPFPEAHFATFPPELAERCIKAGCPKGGTVLDPFGGSGTTGLVADRLQRNAILIELNPVYAEMARKRMTSDAPLFAQVLA